MTVGEAASNGRRVGDPRALTEPFAVLDAEFRLDGYRPGRPALGNAVADEVMCSQHACRSCRSMGLEYRPYTRAPGNGVSAGYRVLALCRSCGRGQEF